MLNSETSMRKFELIDAISCIWNRDVMIKREHNQMEPHFFHFSPSSKETKWRNMIWFVPLKSMVLSTKEKKINV